MIERTFENFLAPGFYGKQFIIIDECCENAAGTAYGGL